MKTDDFWGSYSGGGTLGWLHPFVTLAVAEMRLGRAPHPQDPIYYEGCVGESAGALALLHNGLWEGVYRQANFWKMRLKQKIDMGGSIAKVPFAAMNAINGVYSMEPVDAMIHAEFVETGQFGALKLRQTPRMLVGATRLRDGHYRTVSQHDENFLAFARASTRQPGIMEPVWIQDDWWADGGLIWQVPLRDAIRAGATKVDVFLAHPLRFEVHEELEGARDFLAAGLGHTIRNAFIRDLRLCNKRNLYPFPDDCYVEVTVFQPPTTFHDSLKPPGDWLDKAPQIARQIARSGKPLAEALEAIPDTG